MAEHIEYYGSSVKADKITEIQQEVDNVKQVMLKNLDEIIERGDKVNKKKKKECFSF